MCTLNPLALSKKKKKRLELDESNQHSLHSRDQKKVCLEYTVDKKSGKNEVKKVKPEVKSGFSSHVKELNFILSLSKRKSLLLSLLAV